MLFILIFFIFESKGYFQICLYADGDRQSTLYDFNITCILKKKFKKKKRKKQGRRGKWKRSDMIWNVKLLIDIIVMIVF